MKRNIISLITAALAAASPLHAGVTLTVPEVEIAKGGTSSVVICFDLGTPAYTAYQLDIAYPEGISSESNNAGNPSFTKGDIYSGTHVVSSIRTSMGLDRFQCFSLNSDPFTSQSGTLLTLPIKAQYTLAEGTYQATISPIEFVQTDATPDRPEAVTFSIKVASSTGIDELGGQDPKLRTQQPEAVYDLQGRRYNYESLVTKKGIYISDGKAKVLR